MSGNLSDFPPDVRRALAGHVEPADDLTKLSSIGVQIARKRDEAKAARSGSSIEGTWHECDEAYLGIDDANRGEWAGVGWSKPTSPDGPVTTERSRASDNRSTVYLRLTSRYVDAGVAKLCEILLPPDDKSFAFSEMPVPELIEASDDDSQVVHAGMGAPLTRPTEPGEVAPQAPGAPPGVPVQRVALTVSDLANEKIQIARKRAKAAETRIYDWMVQTQYRAEIRKVIHDSARLGVGVLKGPVPRSKRVMAVLEKGGGVELIMKEKIVPASAWVDPRNIFPDPACGENIHDGDHFFERDWLSSRQVRGLKKIPGYIESQIDQVLEEGPNKINTTGDGGDRDAPKTNGRYEVWYFYGSLTKDEMRAIDMASGQTPSEDEEGESFVNVTIINDSVVKATINPLDSGEFPYHPMPWSRRSGHWAGVGVAEQMRGPQRIVNAALRGLLNNAGKSAGSQFIVDDSITPMDGDMTITPDKLWRKRPDGPADVRQAFMAIQIPNVTEQLISIINLGERFAEETTSIPLISQGMSGATTPNTFGAAQLQNNNANQLLRSIGYAFDDYITEPVVRQYYEWFLLDPDIPNDEKGEFQVNAHGSSALVERAIQDQTIAQLGQMAANPIYKLDPKKWAVSYLRSRHLDPADYQYTADEEAKIDAAPPPEIPAVTVAKIVADTAMKQLAASQTAEQQTAQSEERIAAAAHVLEGGKIEAARESLHVDSSIRLHELQMAHDRALIEYANRRDIGLDQAKAELAKTVMTLRAQKELNAVDNAIDIDKHNNPQVGMRPPAQTPGRAGNGRAFEQGP